MEEFRGAETSQLYGLHLTSPEEADTTIFAIDLYIKAMLNSSEQCSKITGIKTDTLTALKVITAAEEVKTELERGERYLASPFDRNVGIRSLVFLARLHNRGVTANNYAKVCEILGVEPVELIGHGLLANTMILSASEP